MSEIPPDIATSAASTPYQAKEVNKDREARRAGQAHAGERQIKSVDEAGSTVETTDNDVAVFSDAEGTGSQGRESETPEPESPEPGKDASNGITRDDDGQMHVDLEA